jgi:1,4-dihydroxy-2-naphthoate octaprenyltransferase
MSEPSIEVFHRNTVGNRAATLFAATRPAFLTASLLPVLSGIALAWGMSGQIHIGLALLTLLNIALIHSGANVLNDYFDARNGTDAANTQRIFPFSGGSRFIQNGVLTQGDTLRLGLWLMGSGALLGLAFTAVSGLFILWLGIVGGLLAIFYSAPPCLACRGLGDFVIATCFGVLPVVGTVYIQTGSLANEAIWAGAIIGCFVAAILWINSIPDIEADRQAGKMTLPVRLGTQRAPYGLIALFVMGFALVVLAPLSSGKYLALLAIAPATMAIINLLRGQMIPAIPLTLATHASVSILLMVGFLQPLLS